MTASINKSATRTLVLFSVATLALTVLVAISAFSQAPTHKKLLSNVTFKSAYTIKADAESQKDEEARIFASLPSFNVPVTEKKNYAYLSAEGDYHIIRYINQDQPEAGAQVCLTITDKSGNILWEVKYRGEGMPGESDNFIAPTKDNKGYLIQRIIRRSSAAVPSTTDETVAAN